jgi:hypothetical protein
MLDGDIGYVRLYEFVPGVGSGVRNAMQDLRNGGMRALVLDLRGNPGGLVSELRDVSAAFLPEGSPVLQMRTRTGRSIVMQTANPPMMPAALPMVVLVDEGTASAAELLSAAIQEQGRGVIEGTKTAGAVEIGITIDLPEGAGMSVTVAHDGSGQWPVFGGRIYLDGSGFAGHWPLIAETQPRLMARRSGSTFSRAASRRSSARSTPRLATSRTRSAASRTPSLAFSAVSSAHWPTASEASS